MFIKIRLLACKSERTQQMSARSADLKLISTFVYINKNVALVKLEAGAASKNDASYISIN